MTCDDKPLYPSENIAVIAGGGNLPLEIASTLANNGNSPFIVGISGEADDWVTDYDHAVLSWGQIGKMFQLLKERNITKVTMAGGVSSRPEVSALKMDWGAIRSLPQILAFMLGGDNSLLSGVIALFEKHGVSVVGAHEIVPQLLASKGLIIGKKPSRKCLVNMEKAFEACKELGRLDIGQAAVAEVGRVVAVEGVEGTDGMIARIATMREDGKLPASAKEGVLVKTMKPNQDMRVDLPAIGPNTIEGVHKAGLKAIAIEAGRSFILSREETLKQAKQAGILIYGLESTF